MTDLTLLTGENNTGKTFFATVLHRVLDAAAPAGPLPLRSMGDAPLQVRDWVAQALDEPDGDSDATESWDFDPTEDTAQWATQFAIEILELYGRTVRDGISYAFGAEPSQLRRKTRSRRATGCYLTIKKQQPAWAVEIRFDADHVTVTPPDPTAWLKTAFDPERIRRGMDLHTGVRRRVTRDADSYLRRYGFPFAPSMQSFLFNAWPRHAIHLPADRTGIMQSHNVLAGATARQSARAGIKPIQIETLSGTSADFLALVLEILELMSKPSGRRGPLDSVIRRFEKHLRAVIEVDQRANGMDAIVATTPEGSFPMGRSSSMLTELSPLLLVLKAPHLTVDHLTIDEPEAHLHPEMQVRVASFIAELVLHGIRVTVTTHSDFFVSQLKNMMRMHVLAAADCDTQAIETPALEPSLVRSLQFSRENGWCVARGSGSDGVDSVDESTFTQVMRSQYDVTADLINELLATATVPL